MRVGFLEPELSRSLNSRGPLRPRGGHGQDRNLVDAGWDLRRADLRRPQMTPLGGQRGYRLASPRPASESHSTRAPIRSSTVRKPARVGFTHTSGTVSGISTPPNAASTTKKAADEGSAGTTASSGRISSGGSRSSTRQPDPREWPNHRRSDVGGVMRSVWSRELPGSFRSTKEPDTSPASSRALFTWALATGRSYSSGFRGSPVNAEGKAPLHTQRLEPRTHRRQGTGHPTHRSAGRATRLPVIVTDRGWQRGPREAVGHPCRCSRGVDGVPPVVADP